MLRTTPAGTGMMRHRGLLLMMWQLRSCLTTGFRSTPDRQPSCIRIRRVPCGKLIVSGANHQRWIQLRIIRDQVDELSFGPKIGRVSPLSVRPINQEDDQHRAVNLIRRFARSLSKGILFAIPMKPSVTQVLFGIQGKRKNAKQNPAAPSVTFSLRECLYAIGIYLLLGIGAYSLLMEHWSLVDAIYFSMSSFTTVGYGDLHAHTKASKLFTCFFSLGGIAFLGAALASIGQSLVEAEIGAVRAAQRASRKRVMNMFDRMPQLLGKHKSERRDTNSTVTAVVPYNATSLKTRNIMAPPPVQASAWATISSVVVKLIPTFGFLVLGGILIGRLEGWMWLDSIYYAIMTACTVGYGDICPISQRARLFAILFIPFAVSAGGEILGTIAGALLERRRYQVYQNLVERDFTIDHIKEMDRDGDGEVSRLEYMEFMLVEMKLCEQSVIKELHDQFDRLDVTMSDSLTKDDLILMAKMRRSREEE